MSAPSRTGQGALGGGGGGAGESKTSCWGTSEWEGLLLCPPGSVLGACELNGQKTVYQDEAHTHFTGDDYFYMAQGASEKEANAHQKWLDQAVLYPILTKSDK